MMKTLLIFSVLFCVALSIRAAAVVPAKAAAVQQEDKSAPQTDKDVAVPVPAGRAAQRQARFQFCLNGWQGFRGSCYLLVNDFDTWANAESYCANFGASLASAHNIWEYQFIQNMVQTGGHTFAWIGGYFFESEWRWEDGSVFDYHKWESQAPTDSYKCLQLNSKVSKGWSNHGCDTSSPFVCQVKPNC